MSGGGKNQTQTQTTTNKNEPWAPLVPYLTDMFKRGQTALNATPKTPEAIYAGPNANQTNAANQLVSAAGGMNQGLGDFRNMAEATARGDYLMPGSNPALQAGIDAATRPIQENLMRTILPGLADQAIIGGAYGGSGYGVSQGVAAADSSRDMMDVAAAMQLENYNAERNRQMNAGNLIAQGNELGIAPGMLLGQVGDMQQGWAQAALDAQTAAPWNGLDRMAQILGLGGGYGTSSGTNTTTQPGRSGFGSFLGGAAGGASAGSAFGPWGAGIGGILGGLGGLFG